MTPAEVAALTDAEAAERVAVDVMGMFKVLSGWTRGTRRLFWVLGDDEFRADDGMDVFDPCNVPAQALALFEGEHWPWDARMYLSNVYVLIPGSSFAELCTTCLQKVKENRWYARVKRSKHPHPTCRAIVEAVLVAHYGEEEG